jgi:hypothetical protein
MIYEMEVRNEIDTGLRICYSVTYSDYKIFLRAVLYLNSIFPKVSI